MFFCLLLSLSSLSCCFFPFDVHIHVKPQYVVVSVYYKHGEYSINQFYSEAGVRKHLIEELSYYSSCYHEHSNEQLHAMDFKDLCDFAKEVGKQVRENESGAGIVAVIKGHVL
jgi:hypothetical protein